MSKFENLIKEALSDIIGSTAAGIGKVASGVSQTVNTAAQTAMGSGSLATISGGVLDYFKKFKFQLNPVTNRTALKTADGKQAEHDDPGTVSKMAKLGLTNKYTPASVILSPDSGMAVNGIYGRTVNHSKDKVVAAFKNLYVQKLNIEPNFINNTNNLNRFWIQLTGQSDQYVQGESASSEENVILEQEPNPNIPQQVKKILPKNIKVYNTWCIYKGPNAGLFEITEGNELPKYALVEGDKRRPDLRNRQEPSYAFKMEGECVRLLMGGNKTLYPKWYFLNDYEYALNKKKIDTKEPEAAEVKSPSLYTQTTPAATPATTPAAIFPNF